MLHQSVGFSWEHADVRAGRMRIVIAVARWTDRVGSCGERDRIRAGDSGDLAHHQREPQASLGVAMLGAPFETMTLEATWGR